MLCIDVYIIIFMQKKMKIILTTANAVEIMIIVNRKFQKFDFLSSDNNFETIFLKFFVRITYLGNIFKIYHQKMGIIASLFE